MVFRDKNLNLRVTCDFFEKFTFFYVFGNFFFFWGGGAEIVKLFVRKIHTKKSYKVIHFGRQILLDTLQKCGNPTTLLSEFF